MKSNFAVLFNSQSRNVALLTLAELTKPICLNELSELMRCSLSVTSHTLNELCLLGLVIKRRKQNESAYLLNRRRPESKIIELVLRLLEKKQILDKSEENSLRAKKALEFSSSTLAFLHRVQVINDHSRRTV